MIKGIMMYNNFEGISEKLDDGLGNVKLAKKQCQCALFGKDAKIAQTNTWKCAFLMKVVGPPRIRAFYNVNVSQVIAAGADSIDFDAFSEALMTLVIEGLQEQIQKLKKVRSERKGGGARSAKDRRCARNEAKKRCEYPGDSPRSLLTHLSLTHSSLTHARHYTNTRSSLRSLVTDLQGSRPRRQRNDRP
jgi:hypothetical protein